MTEQGLRSLSQPRCRSSWLLPRAVPMSRALLLPLFSRLSQAVGQGVAEILLWTENPVHSAATLEQQIWSFRDRQAGFLHGADQTADHGILGNRPRELGSERSGNPEIWGRLRGRSGWLGWCTWTKLFWRRKRAGWCFVLSMGKRTANGRRRRRASGTLGLTRIPESLVFQHVTGMLPQ